MAFRASVTVAMSPEMYRDLESSAKQIALPISTLVRALVQAHLEKDPGMHDREKFDKQYEYPHTYHSPTPSGNGKTP